MTLEKVYFELYKEKISKNLAQNFILLPKHMNKLPLINTSFPFHPVATGQEQTVYNSSMQCANLSFLPSEHMIHMALQNSSQISAEK
jgi:hypothetical protein